MVGSGGEGVHFCTRPPAKTVLNRHTSSAPLHHTHNRVILHTLVDCIHCLFHGPLLPHSYHTGQQSSEHGHQWREGPSLQQVVTVVAEEGGGVGHQPALTQIATQLPCSEETGVGIRGELTRPHHSHSIQKHSNTVLPCVCLAHRFSSLPDWCLSGDGGNPSPNSCPPSFSWYTAHCG